MIEITSIDNPTIKRVVHLREKRERDKTGLFLIEGYRELLRAYEGGVFLEKLFICPDFFLGSNEQSLINAWEKKGAAIIKTTSRVFEKISYRDRPDGLIAIAHQMKTPLHSLESLFKKKQNPLFIVAESIEKPGNLGTILRSSDAAAVDAVLVADRCTDIYNPNVVRASVGTLFCLPVIEDTRTHIIEWLHSHKVHIIAAKPDAETLYTDIDFTGPCAIAVGTEQLGLHEEWNQQAHIAVRIPMLGRADSLNVATATTLLLYEAVRQRGLRK